MKVEINLWWLCLGCALAVIVEKKTMTITKRKKFLVIGFVKFLTIIDNEAFHQVHKTKGYDPPEYRQSWASKDSFTLLSVNRQVFFRKIVEWFLVAFTTLWNLVFFLLSDWLIFKARESSLLCYLTQNWGVREEMGSCLSPRT